ncbi:BspA family leucine-rich repeat surface protein [Mycoplasma feriruminatoris]|uniref:BspA family leucine-rich repeat surface protein n=1 Tax=Mycoplasma feriruminatoris TaxID=1179777 RepID=UPI00241E47B9|nr:BspA family leucine-rich repeat surface protein [Mycoplasma feriruminatoris]WFQ96211.1 BspA family leucine-rich repeat surface protein [Mycoplasma feriruminatoris]
MKKILTMLTSFSLIATSSVLVVSCKTDDTNSNIKKPKETFNSNHNKEKNSPKTSEHINEMSQGDQPGNQRENASISALSNSNKDNILSSIEDERPFVYGYNKWLQDGKNGKADHFINPQNPNEILLLGFTKETDKKGNEKYRLKQIPKHINKVPKSLPSKVTSLEKAFENNENENIEGIEFWDTSRIISMYQTFLNAKNFNGDITKWKTGNVKDFDYMLSGTNSFNRDLSKWNVSKSPFQVAFAKNSNFDNNRNFWPHFNNKNK